MAVITRRMLLVGTCLAALAPEMAIGADARDFTIDWQGGEQTPDLTAALQAQIALVKTVAVKPDVAAFFAEQVITVDLASDTKTRAGPRGVFFSAIAATTAGKPGAAP